MTDPILEVEDLRKDFQGIVAVDGVSGSFEKDTTVAIIGPNGAGKTTFFRCLAGSVPPSAGTIRFKGEDITNASAYETAQRGLVKSFQIANLFEELPAHENIRLAVQARRDGHSLNFWQSTDTIKKYIDRADEVLKRINLDHQRDVDAELLSYGQRRILEVGVALGSDPELLLLDEPTSGMSPENTANMIELVQDISKDYPVVFIEHNMEVVRSIADRVLVLHNGKVISDGKVDEVRNDSQVRKVYLGE